jgi:hypothetical protein
MSSSSSTSNSEVRWRVGLLEQARLSRFPRGLLGACAVMLVVESMLWINREWFADRAAWQWQVKQEQLSDVDFSGDVAILGSSITFHSVDPHWIETTEPDAPEVVNLALNGLGPAHFPAVLRDYLACHPAPSVLIVEARSAEVTDHDWLAGPWWRFWGSSRDYLASGLPIRKPGTICDFVAHRVWASYSYGAAIDNLLTSSFKERRLSTATRDRNRRVEDEMHDSRGFSAGDFDRPLTVDQIPPAKPRPWQENSWGIADFDEIAQKCGDNGVRLVLFRTPAPPFAEADRLNSGFDAGFSSFVESLRKRHPRTTISVFAPSDYELADFADDHHFSPAGGRKLTKDLLAWIASGN